MSEWRLHYTTAGSPSGEPGLILHGTTGSGSGKASRDYNPSAAIDLIQPAVLALNSADDERNPPETGILKRIKGARLEVIPAIPGRSFALHL